MAITTSWKSYVDTDLNFSEFFARSYTIVLRFMPQFPNAYEGPMVAENGSGVFVLGQGDFLAGTAGSKLYVGVGSQAMTFAAVLTTGQWHHLALAANVSATQHVYTLYLDGVPLGSPLTVAAADTRLPQGTLRFGKRTTGQTINGHDAQYYGILDDIAVFSKQLSQAEIQGLRDGVLHLTGSESNLLAGYNFATGPAPATLARPVTLHGGAQRVTVSASRSNAADAPLLPLPANQQFMDPPFPPGQAWYVIQGYDTADGSHKGYASFCWDFDIADHPQQGAYPNGSDGAPFHAAAPGTVVTVKQAGVAGTANPANMVEIQQAHGEICAYLHLRKDSALVQVGDGATMAEKLALVGDTGANVGAFHLHLAATNMPDGTSGFVTFPVALRDYELRTGGSSWQSVPLGMPLAGQVIRIPPTPTFGTHSLRPGNAIARGSDQLDVVATDVNGRVWTVHWKAGAYANNWDRWRPALADIAAADSPVGVVSRDATRLDLFIAGGDGKTYTGAWDANFDLARWRGWWNILTGAIPAGGTITAVSRDANKLDVFLVSTDGGVYTAAWDQNVASAAWRGWWRIGNLTAKPGAPVAAVARSAHQLDIFVAGSDGKTYTAAWDQNVSNAQWRGWWNILTGAIPAGGSITAVSRDSNKLDVFLVSNDGGVYTAAWDQNVDSGKWRGWWRVGTLASVPGAPVAAVARSAHQLDIFVAGSDGKTYTAAWDQNVSNAQWRGWWNILTGHIAPGGAISAVSRDPDKLDIFISSTDGAIYTAAWDQNVANGQWRGWWRIGI
jgi:hypothetical protein